MDKPKYLPDNKDNKLYSPKNIADLVYQTKIEAGCDENYYREPKNNKLIEMEYASALAVALYSKTEIKYLIYPTENPDIHFIDKSSIDKHQIGFFLEIMTLFDYNSLSFDQNYQRLSKKVWDIKGNIDYDETDLLLISRLNAPFDIDKFIEEMKNYKWNYLRVWLGIFTKDREWIFFTIIPAKEETNIKLTADFNKIY